MRPTDDDLTTGAAAYRLKVSTMTLRRAVAPAERDAPRVRLTRQRVGRGRATT